MQLSDIMEISASIIASLGGGGAIVLALSNRLGRIWADKLMEKEKAAHTKELEVLRSNFLKETESYKIKLKKSEFIFEKQFEAASELVALQRSFLPDVNSPSMEWENVLEHYVFSSEEIEKKLKAYLSHHGAVLGKEVEEKISECLRIASWAKFEVHRNHEVSDKGKKEAIKIYDILNEAKELMIARVNMQTST